MLKKISITLSAITGIAFALPAGATTTQLSIPSIGDFIGYLLDTLGPLLTAFWPLLGILAAFGLFGWVIAHFTRLGR